MATDPWWWWACCGTPQLRNSIHCNKPPPKSCDTAPAAFLTLPFVAVLWCLKQADTQSRPSQQRAIEKTGIPSDWQYQIGDVVDGVVITVKPYGAFIKVDNAVGMLHISQISHDRVKTVDDVFKVCGQQPLGLEMNHGSAGHGRP